MQNNVTQCNLDVPHNVSVRFKQGEGKLIVYLIRKTSGHEVLNNLHCNDKNCCKGHTIHGRERGPVTM